MQQRLLKIKTDLLFFLELQLLISIVILPILIAWGLPISTMSIIGNLVFAQFLTVFIFVSALLFTSDLLGIPNYWIAQALELVTNIWHYFLSYGSAQWLVGFSLWILPISAFFAIAACGIYYVKIPSQNHRLAWLIFFCAATPIIHTFFEKKSTHTIVMQGAQKMHLIKSNGKIYAFDCGALGARPSSQSWIEYTLTPTLVKNMGATHLDALVLCKSNSRTQKAAKDLMQHIPTGKLIELDQEKIRNASIKNLIS
jgi:hypothetical protein